MRNAEILVLLVACLMFAIGMPSKNDPQEMVVAQQQEERQEEEADEEMLVGEDGESYQVTFKSKTREQNKIADALWLRKAAQVALDAGIPYFNVAQQKARNEFDSSKKSTLRVVEGKIVLDNDPMTSDYDANEIMELSTQAP